jgi:hypothetical protein
MLAQYVKPEEMVQEMVQGHHTSADPLARNAKRA